MSHPSATDREQPEPVDEEAVDRQGSSDPVVDEEERSGRDLAEPHHEAGDQAALDAMPGGNADPEDSVVGRQPASSTSEEDQTEEV